MPHLADALPSPTGRRAPAPRVSGASSDALTERAQEILTAAAPLSLTRIQLLRECRDMRGFLFVDDADLVVDDAAVGGLKDSAPAVLDAAIGALEGLGGAEWTTARLEESLRAAIVDGLGIKPRLAFGPVRVAVTGRRVSPPLFESMEILGADSTLARLRSLRGRLG